jgi:hypothetical protein
MRITPSVYALCSFRVHTSVLQTYATYFDAIGVAGDSLRFFRFSALRPTFVRHFRGYGSYGRF